MTNPLTTPSGVNRTVPIPRNPDGSPMTKAQASAARAKEQARQDRLRSTPSDPILQGQEAVDFVNAAFDESEKAFDEQQAADFLNSAPGPRQLSPEEAEQRLAAAEAATDAQIVSATPQDLGIPQDAEGNDILTTEDYDRIAAAGKLLPDVGEHVDGEGQVVTTLPKPENPRQPAKKTPAQKRAETIAAKKAAEEAAIAAQAAANTEGDQA